MAGGLACRELARLYESDPFTHVYLAYDAVYEASRARVYVERRGDGVAGYVLVWRGPRQVALHVWGRAEGILGSVGLEGLCAAGCIVHVHSRHLLDPVLAALEGVGGGVNVRWYLDMVVDEDSFKPYRGAPTVKLSPRDPRHAMALAELKGLQGAELTLGEASRLIRLMRYHGVFEGGKLVSIAGTHVRASGVWVVGDVYTRPEYRGRGYAKAVTSAVTVEAISAGAKALLHVEEDNLPAIRVYEALGYKVIGRKPWVYVSPPASGARV